MEGPCFEVSPFILRNFNLNGTEDTIAGPCLMNGLRIKEFNDDVSYLFSSDNFIIVSFYSGKVIFETIESFMQSEKDKCSMQAHKNPIRVGIYNENRGRIFTGSSKGFISEIDPLKQKVLTKFHNGQSSISCLAFAGSDLLIAGDDEGGLKIYDVRDSFKRFRFPDLKKLHCDQIKSILINDYRKSIATAGADGVISIIDSRKWKCATQTENFAEEINDCCIDNLTLNKGKESVIAATDSGAINFFEWGYWGQVSKRALYATSMVNSLCVSDNKIYCGLENGSIAAFSDSFEEIYTGVDSIEKLVVAQYSEGESLIFTSYERTIGILPVNQLRSKLNEQCDEPGIVDNFYKDLD